LIQFGNIIFYPSPELRRHIKSCKAKEMERGYRITKGSQSSKIDIAIATAMASFGASIADIGSGVRVRAIGGNEEEDDDIRNWGTISDDDDDEVFRTLSEHYHHI